MDPAISSLIDRAGLDEAKFVRSLDVDWKAPTMANCSSNSQAEALTFDNGRLKQATYDTSQGFGLRCGQRRGGRLCARIRPIGRCAYARRRSGTRGQKRP